MKSVKIVRKSAVFILLAVTLVLAGSMTKASAAGTASAAGLVSSSCGGLNVRNDAGVTGSILTKLPPGTYLTLISKTGNWWYIEYAPGAYGYTSADYIISVQGSYAAQVSAPYGTLNVRNGAGASHAITGTVQSGRTVLVLSEYGGWARIVYNGAAIGYVNATYLGSPMTWPVPVSHKINQYFSSTHTGLDIGASVHAVAGDSVIAAASGKVVFAGTLSGYGYVVYIDSLYNGQPIQTRYAHLNSFPAVNAGSVVTAGQRIGTMGSTGTSSGVHLHFEVRIRKSGADCIANADSAPVNPLGYTK